MFRKILITTAAAAAALAAGQATAQDASKGQRVYRACQACHVVDKEQNRVGPHLVGLIGREVASVDGYRYSKAMTEWGEGKVWDEATFLEYIEDPRGIVKGTKMAYNGVKKEQDRADLLAFLKEEGGSGS
ncbi:MAG: c-type cytochrome [Paracoccaceae bacterium]